MNADYFREPSGLMFLVLMVAMTLSMVVSIRSHMARARRREEVDEMMFLITEDEEVFQAVIPLHQNSEEFAAVIVQAMLKAFRQKFATEADPASAKEALEAYEARYIQSVAVDVADKVIDRVLAQVG